MKKKQPPILCWEMKNPPIINGNIVKTTLEVRKNLDQNATDTVRSKMWAKVKRENKDRAERILAAERMKREQLKDECLTELANDQEFREQGNNISKALADLMKAKTGLTDVEAYTSARNKVEAMLTLEVEERVDEYIRPKDLKFTFRKRDIEKVLYSEGEDPNPFWCVSMARFLKLKTQEEEEIIKQLIMNYPQHSDNQTEYETPEEYFEKGLSKKVRHLVYLKTLSYYLFHLSLL